MTWKMVARPERATDLLVSSHRDTDPRRHSQIDRIAAILGVPIRDDASDSGHYIAGRAFGPITHQTFHIPASSNAAYRAHMSCADHATPDHTDTDADDPPQAA